MINQETQDKLSEYGFDVSKLIDAVKSEEERGLDVPTLHKEKGHTKEELTIFGNNRFNEGKSATEEILAKTTHDKYGLDLPEGKEGRKNMEKVAEAMKLKFSTPSDNTEIENNFKAMQSKYEESQNEIASIKTAHENEKFSSGLKQSLTGIVPNGSSISATDAVDLYLMRNKVIKSTDGSAVIELNGEIQKDDILSPINPVDHFKSWLDTSGLIKKEGMNGEDSGSGGQVVQFKNAKEFAKYAEANGISAMDEAGQKFLADHKAPGYTIR